MNAKPLLAVLSFVWLGAACSRPPPTIAIRGATLIDGMGGAPIEGGVLVIADERVRCLGTAAECPVPAGADDVDATGFWIIPGLIDTHMHQRFRGRRLRSEDNARLGFLLGVTTMRDAGTAGQLLKNLEEGKRAQDLWIPVPRLLNAARVTPADVVTPASADSAVRRLKGMGATAIKIHEVFTATELENLGLAARDAGIPVYGHYWAEGPTRSLLEETLDAGAAGLAHTLGIAPLAVPDSIRLHPPAEPGEVAFRLWRRSLWADSDPERLRSIARTVAERGVWIEPLLAVERRYAEPYVVPIGLHRMLELPMVTRSLAEKPVPEMSEEMRLRMGKAIGRMEDFLLAFHEAGGVLATGSDEVIPAGLAIHAEMSALVDAGLSPAAALAAATRDAAVALGAQDSLGTLEPGKIADFVMLEGDPLSDIANAQLVARVAKGGVLYDPATLFDDLADDFRSRTTPPWRRLLAGFGSMVIVVLLTLWGVRRQRTGLESPQR